MRRLRAVLGAVLALALLAGLAWVVYRAYAPGAFDVRLARAQRRWAPFAHWTTWRFLLIGLTITLRLAVVSVLASLVAAIVLALLRLADHPRVRAPMPRWLRAPVSTLTLAVVEVFRLSPLFLLIIFTYIVLPRAGIKLSPFWAGVVALTAYTACVMSEIVRAGILSLERGQFEAAETIGLTYAKRLRLVILPQALRRMVPAIVSQLVTLIKDTSLVSFITVLELARRGQILQQRSFNPIETFLVVMAIYFVVNLTLSELSRRLELRPGRVGRAAAPVNIGAEDQAPV